MKKSRVKKYGYKHNISHLPILLLMTGLLLMLLVPVLMIGLSGPVPLNSYAAEYTK